MENEKLKSVLECLLFVTLRPLTMVDLTEILNEPEEKIVGEIENIKRDLKTIESALQVVQVAEGYQMAIQEGYSYWVKKLFRDQLTFKLSQSALETLSIVAYKQPMTRAEIEEIRGVEVTGVLETLMERKLLKVAGRKEAAGRPLLYATTQEFLRQFGLWKISDLPAIDDLSKEAERKAQAVAQATTGVTVTAAETIVELALPAGMESLSGEDLSKDNMEAQ